MRILIVAGVASPAAEEIGRSWCAQAPGDDVTIVHLPETDEAATARLGLVDVSRTQPEAALDALGPGKTVVVGTRDVHDGGAALVRAAQERWGGLEAARDAVAGTRFLSSDTSPLRGLRGAGARRSQEVGSDAALADDKKVGEFADRIERKLARRDLVGGRYVRWSLEPYSGAGGGVGFALLALGATAEHVREGGAVSVRLHDEAANSDLIVAVMDEFGVEELQSSIATTVAPAAIQSAVPVIIIVGEDHTSRRQRADLGIVGTYSYGSGLGNVGALANRIARTWSVSD